MDLKSVGVLLDINKTFLPRPREQHLFSAHRQHAKADLQDSTRKPLRTDCMSAPLRMHFTPQQVEPTTDASFTANHTDTDSQQITHAVSRRKPCAVHAGSGH